MKEKILTELKKKYTGQLTTNYMESLSERLADKVTKEEDIQTVIADLENSPIKITDLQSEGDRRATELQNKLKTLQDELTSLKDAPKTDPPKPDDVSTQLQAIKSELENFKKTEKQREARATLQERAKEKNIPKLLLDDVNVDSIDQIDDIVLKLEEKAIALKQELVNAQLKGEPPKKGDPQNLGQKQIIDDIKANPIIKKIV